MNLRLLCIAFFSIVAMSAKARAGLLLEPALGYEFGKIKETTSTPPPTDLSYSGTTFGGRLGITFAKYAWIAGDYSSTNGKLGGVTDTRTGGYVDLGIDFPILLRAWVGYGVVNTLKTDTVEYKGGNHIKVGLGLKLLPVFSVNVEYLISDYQKKIESGTTTDLGNNNSSYKSNTFIVGISLPLDI